jgi:ribonuclease HI
MGSGTTLVVPFSQVFCGEAVLKRVILSQDRRVSPSKGGIYRRILYIHQRSELPRVDIPPRIWFQSHIDNIQALLPDGILKVYTDGSFVHHQSTEARIFGKQGTINTGGSVIIMADHDDWRTAPIIAIPISDLTDLHPKSVLTAEAYAILLALIIKKELKRPCLIYTDSQTCIKSMTRRNKLRASYKSPISFPIQAAYHIGPPTHKDLLKVSSHVERRKKSPLEWTQEEAGNYIADRIATLSRMPYQHVQQQFPTLLILHTVSATEIEDYS